MGSIWPKYSELNTTPITTTSSTSFCFSSASSLAGLDSQLL